MRHYFIGTVLRGADGPLGRLTWCDAGAETLAEAERAMWSHLGPADALVDCRHANPCAGCRAEQAAGGKP